MSLLWIQAAWHDARPGTDEWGALGFGHESLQERRSRYVRHVQQVHDVGYNAAQNAVHRIGSAMSASANLTPEEVGFASAPHHSHEYHEIIPGFDLATANLNSKLWSQAPVRHVDIQHTPLHASQGHLNPSWLAHNLFHPGKGYESLLRAADIGHPDVDPDLSGRGRADVLSDLPRMIVKDDGSYVVLDGHHRLGTDKILGKSHARAKVLGIDFFREHRGLWRRTDTNP